MRGAAQARNLLDIYMPDKSHDAKAPVVIYVTGGAWIIGYKAWAAMLGLRLSQQGVVCVALDYRNFPQVRRPHV
jgi:prenylcysteine alpha-carboxyl methylesterase